MTRHIVTPSSLGDAPRRLADERTAELLAGATDVVDRMRQGVSDPEPLIRVARLLPRDIELVDGAVRIGAGAKLAAILDDARLRAPSLAGLVEAIEHTATPQIRAGATVGGALRQRVRCGYYRHPELVCLRKGGETCLARGGDHEAHSIFDNDTGCVAVHPSSLLAALLSRDASVEILDDGDPKSARVEDL
jgi:xanthine dehydrogenase YagS FAD-binding subunit